MYIRAGYYGHIVMSYFAQSGMPKMNKGALLMLSIMLDSPQEIPDFHFVSSPAILSPLLLPLRRLRLAREEGEFHFNCINWILEVAGATELGGIRFLTWTGCWRED